MAAVVSETPSINIPTDPTHPTNVTESFMCCDVLVYIGIAIPTGMAMIVCFGILAVSAVFITRETGKKWKMRAHESE